MILKLKNLNKSLYTYLIYRKYWHNLFFLIFLRDKLIKYICTAFIAFENRYKYSYFRLDLRLYNVYLTSLDLYILD